MGRRFSSSLTFFCSKSNRKIDGIGDKMYKNISCMYSLKVNKTEHDNFHDRAWDEDICSLKLLFERHFQGDEFCGLGSKGGI